MKNCVRLLLPAVVVILGTLTGSIAAEAQTISTVAGGGPVNLPTLAASIGAPAAVRQDSLGNTYIADNNSGRILKVDHTTGLMSVYAGNGATGFLGDGGVATSAELNGPSGMCFDANNDLFIADSDNAIIRVVPAVTMNLTNPTRTLTPGNIYTVVGVQTATNPVFGGDGGPAVNAHLHFPDGCSFDTAGNLYIADRGNNEIRIVIFGTPTVAFPTAGDIYLFAGSNGAVAPNPPAGGYAPNGTAAIGAALYGPFDVFVDVHNNVFIADLGNNFPPAGPNTNLGIPFNNNVIREIPATAQTFPFAMAAGAIYTVAGVQGKNGVGHTTGILATTALLDQPIGISVDAAGNLFFADSVNQVIREVPSTTVGPKTAGFIYDYAGTATKSGYSGDNGPATSANLAFPSGTFLDATDDLFIADSNSNAIREVPAVSSGTKIAGDIYTVSGNGHLSFGGDGQLATHGQLNVPAGIFVDGTGNLIIADAGTPNLTNSLIRKVATPIASGNLSTIAGQPEFNGFEDGVPSVVNTAIGVFVDAAGNTFIADTGNCIIRKLTGTVISTVVGVDPTIPDPINNPQKSTPNCGFTAQGGAAVGTLLGAVNSVVVDASGDIFFSDATNNVIWEVPQTAVGALAAGNAYIVAGTQTTTGSFGGDGAVATSAHLNKPTGIFLDIFGNLFIADTGNNVIREIPADSSGTMTAGSIYTVAGDNVHQTAGFSGEGMAAVGAELNAPFTVAVDHAGNLFIADSNNQIIREVPSSTANGLTKNDIYRVAGTVGTAGFSGDGAAAKLAQLDQPEGLALDGAGDLLVSDSGSDRIRSIAAIANVAPAAVASFDKTSLTFLPQSENIASPTQVVTLTNTGSATLTGITVSIIGANFSQTTTCTATLAAAANCAITVTFTPTALGALTASLSIADNAFGNPQTVALSGTGIAGVPADVLTPNPLAFTTGQPVGVASAPLAITLSNATGTAPLTISNIVLASAVAGDFAQTNTCGALPATVAVGATCTISVTFTPTSATPAARTATLTITDNAADSGTPVAITGTAVDAGITLNPAALAFNNQTVGVPATLAVTVTNTGTAALAFTGLTVAPPNAGDFALTPVNTCGASLATGATCTISVTFTPAAVGARSATLMIADSVTGSPQMIPLTGTGIASAGPFTLNLAPTGAASQTVKAGQTATYNLQIAATGGTPAESASVTLTCTGAPALTTCTVPATPVTVTAATPAAFAATVTTTGAGMLAPQPQSGPNTQPPAALQILPLAVLALLFSIITMLAWMQNPASRLRFARVALSVCLVLMPIAVATLLVGCGGGSSSPSPTPTPTPTSTVPGTYMITVTATSGGVSHSTVLTLIVQ